MKLSEMTGIEISKMIKSGEISVKEVLQDTFDRIDKTEKTFNCYVTVDKEYALQQAEKVQKLIDSGDLDDSPLAGVPIAVKDNICVKDKLTTCSSKILYNFKPVYNATVVEKIQKAGMIIIGKTNMDEFAMGSTTETSAFKITKNPWNESKVPGGSSGGSAACIAAKESVIALGSDTGGSIRQPASYCGVTGLKPTYGTVSRYGLVAFASSLDQIGPLGRDALDCAALYEIISGKDEKDATSMEFDKFSFSDIKNYSLKGKKIGVPTSYFGKGLAPDVKQRVLESIEIFKSLGAEVEEFDLDIIKYAVPTYYIIACAEACSNLSRYDGIKYGYSADSKNILDTFIKSRSEGFGLEVKRRIMLGNFVLSSGYYDAYYNKALKAKKLIQDAFFKAFDKYDFLVGPVAPDTAPSIGENLSDPLKMYMADIYTVMINIAGVPALSIPCGVDKGNMPIGLQLIGKPLDEKTILSAAYEFQRNTDFHKQCSPLL
ncbi:MAG: Asp-tRNA(Asn)/Glu-tRNA(Gln) amidotransferase subunit GatA [Clostridia bacterium]|nr:Asp-tRNA(Asn)/Glu-tRNA(Gln) amidotransferase subunit GatA [Clostridia bacterium]